VVKYEQFVSPGLSVLWQPIDRNGAAKYIRHSSMGRFRGQRYFDNLAELQPWPPPAEVRSREMAVWTSHCYGSVPRTKAVACCRVYFEMLVFTQLVNTFTVWLNSWWSLQFTTRLPGFIMYGITI